MIKIFILFVLFTSLCSIDEIKYVLNRGFLGRSMDRFLVRFNRQEGIQAEYEETPIPGRNDFEEERKRIGKKLYNLTCEELGLPSLKELFKLFNKIDFPNETDWMDTGLFDVPVWYLYVDDKDYHSNVGTKFLEEFSNIVNLTNIRQYCVSRYK